MVDVPPPLVSSRKTKGSPIYTRTSSSSSSFLLLHNPREADWLRKQPQFESGSYRISSMATSICASGFKGGLGTSFYGGWGSGIIGEEHGVLVKAVPSVRVAKPVRSRPMMKNINEGRGVFAPIVVVARNLIGKKRFNQLRGKAIALHSQVQPVAINNWVINFTPLKSVLFKLLTSNWNLNWWYRWFEGDYRVLQVNRGRRKAEARTNSVG